MEKGLLPVTYVVTKIMDGCNALRRRGGNAVYIAPRLIGLCYCRQRYRPSPQARLNYQAICLEALSNPDIQLVNAPFDHYDSDVEGYAQQQSEAGDISAATTSKIADASEIPPEASLYSSIFDYPSKIWPLFTQTFGGDAISCQAPRK